jgi:hypothetical protein
MLQLLNSTPFVAGMALFPNEEAIDTLYVMVKATFNMGAQLTIADEQAPLHEADVYWAEPGKSSVKYAGDYHIGKPVTDIIMIGHACAPGQQDTTRLDVSLTVGNVSKMVSVFGDRQWKDGRITTPSSFKTMPMVYERAYGGIHVVGGEIVDVEARNPVGRGFSGPRKDKEMNGVPLPNLEDPSQLIRSSVDTPTPACFGASAPFWQPRAGYAGTYDELWQRTRAPFLPEDFDKRFCNAAHPDLKYPSYLQGGEPVLISNMHPNGILKFDVPRVGISARITLDGSDVMPDINLETLVLEPNQLRMSLVWRAVLPCDKQALKISDVRVALRK